MIGAQEAMPNLNQTIVILQTISFKRFHIIQLTFVLLGTRYFVYFGNCIIEFIRKVETRTRVLIDPLPLFIMI